MSDPAIGQRTPRQLTTDYAAWFGAGSEDEQSFYVRGLVVLDTNALLALYEIGTAARSEVLNILIGLGSRLWIPHSIAMEFARNRERVVIDRVSRFKSTRLGLEKAPHDAVAVLVGAVQALVDLRTKSRTSRPWEPHHAGLDSEKLLARLDGVMAAAIDELKRLEDEHDLTPAKMQSHDALLASLDSLLIGKIGPSSPMSEVRRLTEEAITFRYPNKIPPGYRDADKQPEVYAAGDYILWRQILAEARLRRDEFDHVMFVTSDVKEDWWTIRKGQAVSARPELVMEMREEVGCHLVLHTLSGFLAGARKFLSGSLSEETVREVAQAETDVVKAEDSEDEDLPVRLMELSGQQFEDLVARLFSSMGYLVIANEEASWFDFELEDVGALLPQRIGVQIKRHSRNLNTGFIERTVDALEHFGLASAVIVNTGSFTTPAREMVRGKSIRLIDGKEFARLVEENLGSAVTFEYRGDKLF